MLLTRYSNIDFIFSLDLPQFFQLISKAYEKNQEERAFQMWVSLYPYMTQEKFVPFEDFFNGDVVQIDNRSAAEIVKDVEELYDKVDWGVKNNGDI